MLNGIISWFTVYVHSYSGMIKPMAYKLQMYGVWPPLPR